MIPAPFNLAEHVLAAGARTPERTALAILGPTRAERWRYGRLIAAVRGMAGLLLDRGLTPGDRVLLRLGNGAEFPVAWLGAIAAGLVPIPTSAQLTGAEITAMAHQTAPRLVLAGPEITLPDHPAPVLWPDLAAAEAHAPADWHMGDADRPAYVIFTSGTSGAPRAVVHAHRAILGRAPMRTGWTGLGPDDRLLHAGAFNWTYTLGTGLLDPWSIGATALVPAAGTDVATLPLLMARHDATILAAVPGVYRRILRAPLPALPRLRHGLSAGEKLAETLRQRWQDATGTPLHEAYGMSECSTFISGGPDRAAPPGTLGYPQPGRRVALIDAGHEAAAGQIAVHRGDPGLMLGYLDRPELTAARFAGDWFLTGDLGRRLPCGAIAYEGRVDDMMTAGGYRVSPIEVEEALASHPGVAEAAAVDLAAGPETRIIAAFWAGPDELCDATLAGHLAERLARYKCPRRFVRLDALPRGANGKLDRRRLREEWGTSHGQT